MKNLRLLLTLALIPVAFGCTQCTKKEADGLKVQSHADNAFMQVMHSSMDGMMSMQMTHDPDHDFAMMMKMHHQGAIAMADKELQLGQDATIKGMATAIKNAQAREVAQLDSFMSAHMAMMDMNMGMMFMAESDTAMKKMDRTADLQPLSGQADYDFSQLMVPHHQSAIEMANAVIKHGSNPFIRQFAEKVIEDQNKEIGQFQSWMLSHRQYGSGGM